MGLPWTGFFPKDNSMNSIISYINGALEELRLVRWPTRQQAIRFSAVVIIFTALSALFFGLIDIGLGELIKTLLSFS